MFELGNKYGGRKNKLRAEDYLDSYSIALGTAIGEAINRFKPGRTIKTRMAYNAAREHAKIFTEMHIDVPFMVMHRLLNVPIGSIKYWRDHAGERE